MNINQIADLNRQIRNRIVRLQDKFYIDIIIGSHGEYEVKVPLFDNYADKSQFEPNMFDSGSYDLIDMLVYSIKNLDHPILTSELLDLGQFLCLDAKRLARLMNRCQHYAEVS